MQAREGPGPARQLLRPGREKLAARIRRKCRRRKRGPRPKTATVERREARVPPALRDAGTPLGARPATLLRANRCRCTGAPVVAPPTPRWGGKSQTPGANAPREQDVLRAGLFDIVRRECRH